MIVGPFGAGKTAMISTISGDPVVGTEVPTTGVEAKQKASTTVGLEYGVLQMATEHFDIDLLLYGTPGQERFRFMWDAAAIGADGFVVLVDATDPDTWDSAAEALAYVQASHAAKSVVAANRATARSKELIRVSKQLDLVVPNDIPVVACDVTDNESMRVVLIALLDRILLNEDEAIAREGELSHAK